MKFSLITTTIGRTAELKALLASLDEQTCRSFELIIVDQNSDDRLAPILESHRQSFPIVHTRSAKGAARGRNVGIEHARGDLLAFPDDDCFYPRRTLAEVARLIDANPDWDGLCGRPANTPRWSPRSKRLSIWNLWRHSIEWTMFLRRGTVEAIGPMNETLGPGAGTPYGAGEGAEYLIRALQMGCTLNYEPSIEIHHPPAQLSFETHLEKSRRYAMGQGRVLQLRGYPAWYAAYHWTRPLYGAAAGMVNNDPERTMVALAVTQGIIGGWSTAARKQRNEADFRLNLAARRPKAA